MKRLSVRLAVLALLLGAGGCVEVQQLIKMEHDGSGTLTETVIVKPRALRLLASLEQRTGKKQTPVELLSDEALQLRVKAYGEVTVKEKKTSDLPDGGKQIRIVYAFQDANKIRLYAAPIFKSSNKNASGRIALRYDKIIPAWPKGFSYADQLSLDMADPRPQRGRYSNPAEVQAYRRVTSIFQDMLRDLRFRIEVQSPDDVEELEKAMVDGPLAAKNRLLVMDLKGFEVIQNFELIRSFAEGEVGVGGDDWGQAWRALQGSVPATEMPYGGLRVRFLKRTPAPDPNPGAKK